MIALASLSRTFRLPVGRMRSGTPTRSPACTRISARAKVTTSIRSSLDSCASGEENSMEGERSGQSHTVCAASHSRSRTYRCSSRAERRQSTRRAGSPEKNRRYCQKFSPGPARLRPCRPWITVAEMRRASRMSRGSSSASTRATPLARCADLISSLCPLRAASIVLSETHLELANYSFDAFPIGAGSEGKRHAMLEDGLSHVSDIVDGRRKSSIDKGAGTRGKHQGLTRPRTGPPGDQLADIAALRTRPCRTHQREDCLHHRLAYG